jgi:hypothetical protein
MFCYWNWHTWRPCCHRCGHHTFSDHFSTRSLNDGVSPGSVLDIFFSHWSPLGGLIPVHYFHFNLPTDDSYKSYTTSNILNATFYLTSSLGFFKALKTRMYQIKLITLLPITYFLVYLHTHLHTYKYILHTQIYIYTHTHTFSITIA